MSPDGSKVRVELDMDELVAAYVFETQRRMIDSDGARGIWNGFGRARVVVNGEPVLDLHLHEDKQRRVVLEITGIAHGQLSGMPTIIEIERDGIVPPRTGRN